MQEIVKVVKVRSPSWPRGGAADLHSCVPLARLSVQKVAEPLQEKKRGGLFLKALAWDQMLPVRAVEGADRQRFCSGIQRWMEPSAQLLSSPAVAASAAGLFCRIFLLETKRAGLLLLLHPLPKCTPQHCYWCWPSGSTQTAWKDQQVKKKKHGTQKCLRCLGVCRARTWPRWQSGRLSKVDDQILKWLFL